MEEWFEPMTSIGKERDNLPHEDLPQELVALLLQIASGDRRVDDPSTQKELQRWRVHQSAIDDWLRTAEFAGRAFADDREIKRVSNMEKITEADRALARRALAPHLPGPRPAADSSGPAPKAPTHGEPRVGANRRHWLVAATILVVAGAAAFAWRNSKPAKPEPPIMLSQGMQLIEPLGQVPALARFKWKGAELPLMGRYHLRVETPAGALLLEVDHATNEYTPSPVGLERIHSAGRVKWMVETLDRAGRRVAWGSWQEAWLAGH